MRRGNKIRTYLAEALDEGLTIKLGNSCKQVIIFHIAKASNISEDDISKKPDKFASGLEESLGEGSYIIEKNILKTLYSKCGLEFKERLDRSFSEYIEYASRHIT